MRVESGAGHSAANQRATSPTHAGDYEFGTMLATGAESAANASAGKADGGAPDFTGMTRQELFDWMNGQILSGKMSLKESTPFLSMTVKVSGATGQPVDMATDAERIDFIDRARGGIEFHLSHFDYEGAARLQRALEIMQQA